MDKIYYKVIFPNLFLKIVAFVLTKNNFHFNVSLVNTLIPLKINTYFLKSL